MATGLGLIGLVPLAIVVVAVLAVALAGKSLKCPNCGTSFGAPAMDAKRSGIGWTFPYLGKVKCPKCGETRSRRSYQKAPPDTQAAT